jgi:hypothetical protein
MSKFLISESEKVRILNMHKTATHRQYLSEQSWKWKQGDPTPEKLDPNTITTTVTLEYVALPKPVQENGKTFNYEGSKLNVDIKGIPNLSAGTFVYEFTLAGRGMKQFGPITNATVNGDVLSFNIPLKQGDLSLDYINNELILDSKNKKQVNYVLSVGVLPSYYDTKQLRQAVGMANVVANQVQGSNPTPPVAQQPQNGTTQTNS